MMEHVKPNPDRDVLVRDPYHGGRRMPAEGHPVDTSLPQWWQMLRAQRAYGADIVRVRPAAPARPAAKPPKTERKSAARAAKTGGN